MVADMAANMEVHTVADIEVDKVAVKVADMVANMAAEKKKKNGGHGVGHDGRYGAG